MHEQKYIEILKEQLLPFAKSAHGRKANLTFQEDGCGPHRAKSVRSFFDAEGIKMLPWRPESPDINTIENAWGIIKRNLRQQPAYLSSRDGLFERMS